MYTLEICLLQVWYLNNFILCCSSNGPLFYKRQEVHFKSVFKLKLTYAQIHLGEKGNVWIGDKYTRREPSRDVSLQMGGLSVASKGPFLVWIPGR